ncbi:MAG: malonyl-CoA decarboxylase family protein [Pseudomonadota bacterium]
MADRTTQRSPLGDMLSTLFDRRARRTASSDDRSIADLCRALLASEGEVSGLTLARCIVDAYGRLSLDDKLAFFHFLNEDLEINLAELTASIDTYRKDGGLAAYEEMSRRSEPPRQELLRRINQTPGATRTLVEMRSDILRLSRDTPELRRLDHDFKHLLRSWFNRGFLVLRRIDWNTSASLLEKIISYEAVHAINDLEDLRRRLYPPDRRCFAYFHPAMPEEPLIFVQVALTQAVPSSIQHILAHPRDYRSAEEVKVAVFYSISNCQHGLSGISFGNLLIKQVVDELRAELPALDRFVTLSPIPKLNTWLEGQRDNDRVEAVLTGEGSAAEVRSLATTYLLKAKNRTGLPYDPVARFHLGNGARVLAVHSGADLSANGLRQSSGAMVNYEYNLDQIEANHERFVEHGEVATAPTLT